MDSLLSVFHSFLDPVQLVRICTQSKSRFDFAQRGMEKDYHAIIEA